MRLLQIDAVKPRLEGDKPYHIRVPPGSISRYVLLPGDPERALRIARTWDEWWEVARHREFWTYSGKYKGVPISVTSTGIGGPSTAIAIEELLMVGADTFIRVGTTAALRRDIELGDVIISVAAVRLDGTSKSYVIPEYPAVASLDVTMALVVAAEQLGVKYHLGITASTDSFYVGQGRPGYKGYIPPWSRNVVEFLRNINVLNFEMEASTIFTLAQIYGVRAGAVCAVIANRETNEFIPEIGVDTAIKVANEAVKILGEWDKNARERKNVIRAMIEWLRKTGAD